MLKTLKDLINLLDTRQKTNLFKLQLLVIIMALLELMAIASIGPFMAIVANPGIIEEKATFQQISNFLGTTTHLETLIYIGSAVLGILALSLLFSLFVTWKLMNFGANLGSNLSSRLFRYYMNQNWLFHSQNHSAELTTKISAETYRTTQGIIQPMLTMVSKVVLALFISISIFLLNPIVAIVGLTIFGSTYLLIYTTIKVKLSENGMRISSISAIRFRAMSEGFGGIKDTLLLNLQNKFSHQFELNSNALAKSQSSNQFYACAPRYILEMIAFGSVIMLIIFLIITKHGELDKILPTISIYALAGFKLMPALQNIFLCLTQIKANTPAFDTIKEDLNKGLISPLKTENKPIPFKKGIKMESISFTYPGKNTVALKNICINIPKNQSIALVGSSGSGKSTAIDILLGLIKPNSGHIYIDDKKITPANIQAWQKKIGYVPQQIFLSDQTIAENIAFGLEKVDISPERLKQALSLSKLDELIETLKDGVNTAVGERGLQLSGGQRQRIGIARALYNNPEIIVFDEATSALDGITEKMIMESIDEISNDRTIIMIAHRLSTIEKCDNIYMLEDGNIIDQGDFKALINKNDKFRRMSSNNKQQT